MQPFHAIFTPEVFQHVSPGIKQVLANTFLHVPTLPFFRWHALQNGSKSSPFLNSKVDNPQIVVFISMQGAHVTKHRRRFDLEYRAATFQHWHVCAPSYLSVPFCFGSSCCQRYECSAQNPRGPRNSLLVSSVKCKPSASLGYGGPRFRIGTGHSSNTPAEIQGVGQPQTRMGIATRQEWRSWVTKVKNGIKSYSPRRSELNGTPELVSWR